MPVHMSQDQTCQVTHIQPAATHKWRPDTTCATLMNPKSRAQRTCMTVKGAGAPPLVAGRVQAPLGPAPRRRQPLSTHASHSVPGSSVKPQW
jgi:hypothetical protein